MVLQNKHCLKAACILSTAMFKNYHKLKIYTNSQYTLIQSIDMPERRLRGYMKTKD
jgi:hypothetical protein